MKQVVRLIKQNVRIVELCPKQSAVRTTEKATECGL